MLTAILMSAILLTAILSTAILLSAEMLTCGRRRCDGMLRPIAGEPRKTQRTMSYSDAQSRLAAFTLVELLVVMGIIAVLIAILLPVLGKARAQANRTVCLSNIRQLGTSILMYCNDNDGWFPTCANADDGIGYRPYPDDWLHWQANRNLMDSAIAKYVGGVGVLKTVLWCPADTLDGRQPLPSIAPGQGPYLYSYSMNAAIGSNDRSGSPVRTKLTQWRAPSRKILLTEPWDRYRGAGWLYSIPLTRRHGSGRFRGNVPGNPDLANGVKIGINVSAAFLDGHADSIDFHASFDEIHIHPTAR